MKAKVYISQLTEFEIDNWDFEGSVYDIPEDLNEFGLFDFDNELIEGETVQEYLDSFNEVLHTFQVLSIDQFYYGGGGIQSNKDKKLHLEITIEHGVDYNKENLQWIADEFMRDLNSASPGIHGVYVKLLNKANIDKIEEVNDAK